MLSGNSGPFHSLFHSDRRTKWLGAYSRCLQVQNLTPQPAVDNFSSHLLNSTYLPFHQSIIDSASYIASKQLDHATPIPHSLNMSSLCQSCGSAATNRCTRCHKVAYCNRDCQQQDWKLNHRDACKDNQLEDALQRVAEIVLEAYLTFRENTWDTPIDRVEVCSRGLTIYDGDQRLNTRYFTAFPNNIVGDDEEVKKSVLTAWACEEPYAFLHNLIMSFLKGDHSHCLLANSADTS